MELDHEVSECAEGALTRGSLRSRGASRLPSTHTDCHQADRLRPCREAPDRLLRYPTAGRYSILNSRFHPGTAFGLSL